MAILGGRKQVEDKGSFWRLSLIRAYKSLLDKGTPVPFAELRCFMFLDKKPTLLEQETIFAILERTINELEHFPFNSIEQARYKDRGTIESEDDKRTNEIGVRKVDGKIAGIEIDGYEISELQQEEVMRNFKRISRIRFNKIYSYFALYDNDGGVIRDYDENDIAGMIVLDIENAGEEEKEKKWRE